jgi:hypothetical protein
MNLDYYKNIGSNATTPKEASKDPAVLKDIQISIDKTN